METFVRSVDDVCITSNYSNGDIQSKIWFNSDDQNHRLDGPAYIHWAYNNNGDIFRRETWVAYGRKHRDDGPAMMTFKNDKLTSEHWYRHDCIVSNKKEPGSISYNDQGEIMEITWYYENGLLRKSKILTDEENNLYKCIWYNEEGNIDREETICEDLVKSN